MLIFSDMNILVFEKLQLIQREINKLIYKQLLRENI